MRRRYALQARIELARAIGLKHTFARFRHDRQHRRALVSRRPVVADQMWRDAAEQIGAEVRELAPTLLEFSLNGAVARIRGQTTPFADPVSDELSSDKPVAYRLLAAAGLPVPAREIVDVSSGRRDADGLLGRVGAPCLVKPAAGAGGDGVSGEIRSAEQLRLALTRAGKFNEHALVERQAPGDSYRLLLLDGELLDVIRRTRPRVTGDGDSTIGQLILGEYERRIADEGPSGLKHFVIDLDCLFTLAHAGLTVDSILPAGKSAVVKTATNYNGPAETETLSAGDVAALLEPARRAASTLGVRLAGVDIVTADPMRPLAETEGVVLEVNGIPGLTHHYNVAARERATPVAVPILLALLRR